MRKNLVPFILTIILPGTGHIFLKQYLKGFLILAGIILSSLLIPKFAIYIVGILLIISVADIYLILEKAEGRSAAIRNLTVSIIIVLVIFPVLVYLLFTSFKLGGDALTSNVLNPQNTEKEMQEISIALEKYHNFYNSYPENYIEFVDQKPIRSHWSTDGWNNAYRYSKDSITYTLVSAGKDGVFDTEDDLIVPSNSTK